MTSPFLQNVSFWLEPVFIFIDFPPVVFHKLNVKHWPEFIWYIAYICRVWIYFFHLEFFLNPDTDLWYKLFHIQKSKQNYCDRYCKKVTWCGRWFCNTPWKFQETLKSSISFILKHIIIIIIWLTFLLQVV